MLLGYLRVSKGDDQNPTPQRRALREAGCGRLFEDTASSGRWDRPELHRMLDQLRPGNVVVVWKMDRLSRSLKDMLHILKRITAAEAGFHSLTEAIDTTTPAGVMFAHMVGAFAEYERAMVRERTRSGLAAAREAGRRGGRRPKLTEPQRASIAEDVLSERRTAAEAARFWQVSDATVSRIVAQARRQRAEASAG